MKVGSAKLKSASQALKRKLSNAIGAEIPTPGGTPVKKAKTEEEQRYARWVKLTTEQLYPWMRTAEP